MANKKIELMSKELNRISTRLKKERDRLTKVKDQAYRLEYLCDDTIEAIEGAVDALYSEELEGGKK